MFHASSLLLVRGCVLDRARFCPVSDNKLTVCSHNGLDGERLRDHLLLVIC